MKQLEAATELTTGSLYNSFGNKDGLFRAALQHYIDTVVAVRIERYLMSGPPRAGILAFVREGLERGSRRLGSGCLLVNSLVEAPLHSATVQETIAHGQRRIDEALEAAVKRGIAKGELSPGANPRGLALQLSLAICALLLRSRAEDTPGWFEAPMVSVEALLEPPAARS